MRRVVLAGFFFSLISVFLAGPASAGPFRMTGYDTAAMGQGGSEMAWGQGLGVLYHNPALLVDVERGFSVGYFVVQPFLRASLMDRPANADIPISFYDSDEGIEGSNLDRPLPTSELRNPRADNVVDSTQMFLGIGIAHDLGVKDFKLGLAMLVPTDAVAAIHSYYPDEREQYFSNTVHFSRYGEWSRVLSILMGMAYRPLEWLSVGASLEGSLSIGATIDMFIPEATVQDYALVNASFDAKPSARGIFGVTARPLDWLSVSLVWRDRRFTKVDAEAMLNLWNYHEPGEETIPKRVEQRHLMALDFEPMEVSLAVGARWEKLSGEVAVTWNHWADFLDSHHQRAQETAVIDPATQGETMDEFAFSDTWSVTAGATYEYLDGFAARLGFGYRPTPVPPQIGRTNYVDEDLLLASVGHRFDFELLDMKWRAELAFQFIKMMDATVYKDPSMIRDEFSDEARTVIGSQLMPEAAGLQTNNPGFPGFEYGGWGFNGSFTLSYLF